MREDLFDILIYVFENYMGSEIEMPSNLKLLQEELLDAGFHQPEVHKAFDWLQGLALQVQSMEPCTRNPTRIFTREEHRRLDLKCRGLLLSLEQGHILSPATRELVIERVMALNEENITLEELKWIILMVLFNQPDQEEAFALMENMVYGNQPMLLH